MAVDEEGADPIAPVAVGFGCIVAWLSLAGTIFLAADRYLIAGLESGSRTAQDASTYGLLVIAFFLILVGPFLAVALWASVHDVAVQATSGAGTVSIDPLPLFGVVEGGMEPLAMGVLVLVGVLTASRWADSLVGKPIAGTILGTAGYVVPAWLLMMLSAVLYNVLADVFNSMLGSWVGVAGDVDLAPMLYYPDTVGAFVQLTTFAAPFVAVGAVGTTVLSVFTGIRSNSESTGQSGEATTRETSTAPSRSDTPDATDATDEPDDRDRETTTVFDREQAGEETAVTASGDDRWREEWYDEDRRRDDRS